MSKINLANPELNKYPKFSKAKPIEFIINPGEMLFLPAYWWHQVYSIDLAVSMNIWWNPLRRQYLVPGALHFFLARFIMQLGNLLSRAK